MNYGGKGIKQKKKLLNSATTKLGTKLGIFFIKLALVAAIAVVVSGSCLVLGSFQGIIENAPDIASVNVSPEGFATKIYDSDENEIQTLSSAGANRTYVTIDQIPKDLQLKRGCIKQSPDKSRFQILHRLTPDFSLG